MTNWLRNIIRTALLVLALTGAVVECHAQRMALKTNALLDVACIPNLTLDIATSSKTTLSIEALGSWSCYGEHFKTYGCMPEFRYWISGRAYNKWFIGVGAVIGAYDVKFRHKIYEGEAYGGGITFGYDFWLGRHWSLDLHAGVSPIYYRHRMSYSNDILDFPTEYKDHGVVILPMQLGVSFVYIIK